MQDTTPLLTQLDQSLQILDAAMTESGATSDAAGLAVRLNEWLAAARDWVESLQSPGASAGGAA